MKRRNFLVGWITSILYAIFPSLRPKLPAPITYGGMDLRELLAANSEFRMLEVPYIISPGIPIGLLNEDECARVRAMKQGWSLGLPEENREKSGPGKIKYTERNC